MSSIPPQTTTASPVRNSASSEDELWYDALLFVDDECRERQRQERDGRTGTGSTRPSTSMAADDAETLETRTSLQAGPSSRGDGTEGDDLAGAADRNIRRLELLERLRGVLRSNVAWEGQGGRSHTASLIRRREMEGHWSSSKRARVTSTVLPKQRPMVVASGNSRGYIGHFAADGEFFVAGFQNQVIRLYDMASQARHSDPWKLKVAVSAKSLNWTITDTCLCKRRRLLVYSTISPVLHAVKFDEYDDETATRHTPIDFGEGHSNGAFGLWAMELSHDGNFLLAGSSDNAVYLYDLEDGRLATSAVSHSEDVNSVCFLDSRASDVFISAGDDCMIKVWDLRCLAPSNGNGPVARPQGTLPGHTEGVAHVSPKGDGRYLISNGKDQKCKLWDVRIMRSGAGYQSTLPRKHPKGFEWDYRWQPYPSDPHEDHHPDDCSIATFFGHKVLQTLIRCRWSPAETTGQRYVFSGSQCGGLFVWDVITGQQVAVYRHHRSVVRDCDWHPHRPMLATVGWDGNVVQWQDLAGEDEEKGGEGG